ncbi:MAG: heparinase II/III family protein [Dysgonomonas sp.]
MKTKYITRISILLCFSILFFLPTNAAKKDPSLFVNKQQLENIKVAIKGTHRRLWYDFQSNADAMLKRTPPKYRADIGEQLWQRSVGETISNLAFAGLVSENPEYFRVAAEWAKAACNYPTWGLDRNGNDVDYGLPYGHQLLGLAMLYDYGHDYLDKDVLEMIKQTMISRTSRQYAAYKDIKHGYIQNHTWINATGMLAAGLALKGEYPESEKWVSESVSIFDKTIQLLSPDGASQEGVGYWTYGCEFLLASFHLLKENLGLTAYYDTPWFKQTSLFGSYLRIPRRSWRDDNNIIDISDSKRFTWSGPEHIFRGLAAVNKDGISQWYANESGKGKINISWYNIVFYDPTVEPISPETLPTLKYFSNMGIVSARSDWSGKESMVVFKCGAPLGKAANELASTGLPDVKDLGHVHPDANHFVIFANGEYLIKNNGYVKRQTKYHNTLLIDDKGQWGEVRTWFSPFPLEKERNPVMVSVEPGEKIDRMTGDASHAYFDESGLKKFVRKLIYVKPDVLVVVDDLEVDSEKDLTLLFYPEFTLQQTGTHLMTGTTRRNNFRMEVLTPTNCSVEYTSQEVDARHEGGKESIPVVKLKSRLKQFRNITAFSWSGSKEEPVVVGLKKQGEKTKLQIADQLVDID